MVKRVRLIEIFREHEVWVKGGSQYGRYEAIYKVVPRKNPKRVTLEDLDFQSSLHRGRRIGSI